MREAILGVLENSDRALDSFELQDALNINSVEETTQLMEELRKLEDEVDMKLLKIAISKLNEKVEIVTGDIKEAANIFGLASFDVITTNPPYMIGQHGIANESDTKAIARHEVLCTLDDILRESARILRPGGRFYMVHRPFRLAEILSKMVQVGIEPKRMRMVHPFIDKEPNMVLIEGKRGGNSRMTVERPLIVYKEQGVYSEELLGEYGLK